jgi:hypothetical protein
LEKVALCAGLKGAMEVDESILPIVGKLPGILDEQFKSHSLLLY